MEKYINSIFEKQTEQPIEDLILSYARENGLDVRGIDKLIAEEEEFCSTDIWGGLIYSKGQIKEMLNKL